MEVLLVVVLELELELELKVRRQSIEPLQFGQDSEDTTFLTLITKTKSLHATTLASSIAQLLHLKARQGPIARFIGIASSLELPL